MKPRPALPEDIKELMQLVRAGKLFAVQKWIAAGKRVAPPQPYWFSPLRVAMNACINLNTTHLPIFITDSWFLRDCINHHTPLDDEVGSYINHKPLINVAVDGRAEHAHIMIQETGKACIACMNPGYLADRKAPCFVPSCIDCLFVADGLALFAITSVLLARPRNWNFRNVHLAGFVEDSPKLIERKPNCPLCSSIQVVE